MNPYKKNLNGPNGWILCPSKSFPGKYYYFNVANGETAWTLSETEKKSIKNPTIQKIENPHCYPEPNHTPPGNYSPTVPKPTVQSNFYNRDFDNSSYNKDIGCNYPNRTISNNFGTFMIQPTPFGHNYSQPALPIQIQVPFLGSDFHNSTPQIVMIWMNQNPAGNQLAIQEPKHVPVQMGPDRDLFVNTSKMPLSQRFVNNGKPNAQFTDNRFEKQPFGWYNMSTPNKLVPPIFPQDQSSINCPGTSKIQNNDIKNKSNTLIHEPNFSTTNTEKNLYNTNLFAPSTARMNFSPIVNQNNQNNATNLSPAFKENLSSQNIFQSNVTNPFRTAFSQKPTSTQNVTVRIPKSSTSTNQEAPRNLLKRSSEEKVLYHEEICKEKLTLNQSKKADVIITSNDAKQLTVENLDENDLRRTLMAKKRKTVDSDHADNVKGKKIKTFRQENNVATPKKKVTFNLVTENMSDISSTEDFSYDGENAANNKSASKEVTAIQALKLLASPSKTSCNWYVVVDTTVLVEELPFLDDFVQLDPKCHLLIPSSVMSDTTALSRGECRERHLVTLARHTIRRLATPQPHIIVQPFLEDGQTYRTTSDSIINCCIQVMHQNEPVVLLTNDENLRAKAESLHIPCSDCEQIKNSSVQKPEVHFDIKKIMISIPNVPENLDSHTNTYKNPFDSPFERTQFNQLNNQDNCSSLEFSYNNDVIKTSNAEWERSTKTNITDNLSKLKIQNKTDNSQIKIQTTPKILSTIQNSNETVSFYFQNGNSKLKNDPETNKNLNPEAQSQTVSFYFQNEKNVKEQRLSSIFKRANDKPSNVSVFEIGNNEHVSERIQSKRSIFEIDGIEKIETKQLKPSIFDDLKADAQKSIYKTEKSENKKIKLKRPICDSGLANRTVAKKSLENDKQIKEAQSKASILEKRNCVNKDVPLKPSIFEKDKCENKDIQLKPPIIKKENIQNKDIQLKSSNFTKDKCENKDVQLKPPTIKKEKCNNKDVRLKPSIFEKEKCKKKEDPVKPSIFEIDVENKAVLPYEMNNKDLEDCVERFYLKNKIEDDRIEQKKEEIICNFTQVMEECLSNVLQHLASVYTMAPPWTLNEALQCVAKVYPDHKTVRTAVNILSSLLKSEDITNSDVVKIIGCGFMLVRYLKKITPNQNPLIDAEDSLNTILQNLHMDIELFKPPVFCRNNTPCEDYDHRRNFVKDRSEIVKYLKKHFPAWADYDETFDDAKSGASWGQSYKNVKIVRTCGKNLGMLKFSSTKSMTLNQPPNTFNNIDENNSKENVKEQGIIIKRHINLENSNNDKVAVKTVENVNVKDMDGMSKNIKILSKADEINKEVKIVRVVINKPKTVQNDNSQNKIEDENQKLETMNTNFEEDSNNIDDPKQKSDSKQSEPKVIRLFNDIKLIKEESATDSEKPVCNLDYTHGHTFGTDSKNGPKVVRNVQIIKEFEEKIKSQRTPLDLDKLDYSAMSESDDDKNDDSDPKNDPPKNLDNKEKNDNETKINDNPNTDHPNNFFDATNDISLSETLNLESFNENTSQATNNDVNSMSFDICVSNDIYATNDFKTEKQTDESNYATNDNSSTNDNHFSPDYVSCLTNIVSCGTNDFRTTKEYLTNNGSDATNDKSGKVTQKDDTNDSGFENESLLAYSVLKSFLSELNESFHLVRKFIEASIEEFRRGTLLDSKRRSLHSKSSAAHNQITKIIDKLQCIIQRESSDSTTIKALIAGAGAQATEDKHISRYRFYITQCLRQAQMLDRALKMILSVTDGNTICMQN